MKIFLLLCLVLPYTYSSLLAVSYTETTDKTNLGFSNSTGAGVTEQMLKDYINTINAASSLYKDNVQANARYIKKKLDSLYGKGSQNYNIYIQPNNPLKQGYSIWTPVTRIFAELNGVNIINPSWSYLIIQTYGPYGTQEYSFLQPGTFGAGITYRTKLAIMDIIQTFQTSTQCSCSKESIVGIRKSLESYFDTYQFNVLCDDNGVTSALVYVQDKVWGTFKGKCYYTLYKST